MVAATAPTVLAHAGGNMASASNSMPSCKHKGNLTLSCCCHAFVCLLQAMHHWSWC